MGRSMLLSLCLLALPVVAAADTRVDFDPSKDFSLYRTYAVEVAAPIDTDGDVDSDNTLAEDRLRRAVELQLQMRGLTMSPNAAEADLIVKVASRQDERTVVQSYGPYPYGYGPWGWGYGSLGWGYWGAGYWGPYSDIATYTYIEEAVRVDLIEQKSGDLVYRAQVVREAEDDADEMTEHAIKTARKAFKKYPVGPPPYDDD